MGPTDDCSGKSSRDGSWGPVQAIGRVFKIGALPRRQWSLDDAVVAPPSPQKPTDIPAGGLGRPEASEKAPGQPRRQIRSG